MPVRLNERIGFRENREQLVATASSPSQRQSWKTTEEGQRYASVTMTFTKDGYSRLEQQIDRMTQPIRRTRSRASRPASDKQVNNLIREVGALSTRGGSSSESQASKPAANSNASAGLRPFISGEAVVSLNDSDDASQGILSQENQDETYKILPSDIIGYSDPPIFGAYMSLMAHYRLIKQQILTLTSGRAVNQVTSFLTRELSHFKQQRNYYEPNIIWIARHKIERFRAIALEFVRTVPTGVLDQLNINQHDWATMQWLMMSSLNAWFKLAPLERKLDGLETNTVPEQSFKLNLVGWGKNGNTFGWTMQLRRRYMIIDVEGS
ncbi:unnamed protein product [Rhizoctonia solani]|uniref:Uncharacterized protein n=1 Tax=Rhizoctonia solani TaxID=456999 RepID=A0A8H3CR63_9AGAM|nr:unnamed protein product [Rhizoctonia solani]